MLFLAPPETKYFNYYDQSRFNLVWKVCVTFVVLMSIVSISNFTNENYSSIPNFIAIGIGIISLLTLNRTRKFQAVSMFISISCLILISLTMFLMVNVIHYTTPMWMVMNIIFTFFTLGRKWGISVLVIHFTVTILYFCFRIENNIANLPSFTQKDIINFSIEYAICGLGIAYFLHQFVKTSKYAERKFKTSNRELNKQNKIISKQNLEKEIMLKEIHHRVKNNLQVITSLLRLQSYELKDSDSSKEFNDAINRVNAMALIHEKMYQSEMFSDFDLKNYLTSLAKDLLDTYALKKQVELTIHSEITSVGSKTIVPLALMFNELISNSVKHAFIETESPEIVVSITPSENNYFTLHYQDNGTWKENGKKSFGTELIYAMTEQLDGEVKLEHTQNKTVYTFRLKSIDEELHEKI